MNEMELPDVLARAAGALGSRLLRLDPDSFQRLAALAGRVVCIEFTEPAARVYLRLGSEGLHVERRCETAPDVTLIGSPVGFARLAGGGARADAFAASGVKVRGDIETAERLRDVFAAWAPDWEEFAARVAGDVPAHLLCRTLGAAGAWTRRSAATLARDLAEYLEHESGALAPAARVERFLAAVDALRSDVERLEQRLERIARTVR